MNLFVYCPEEGEHFSTMKMLVGFSITFDLWKRQERLCIDSKKSALFANFSPSIGVFSFPRSTLLVSFLLL